MPAASPAGVLGWFGVLALIVLMPVLRFGYALNMDMVFTPRQNLVPDSLGLGAAPPRAVPVDAWMSMLTWAVDGQWVQKVALFGTLVGAGWGAAVLVPSRSRATQLLAGTLYVWNPYVAERLAIGHWSLLIAYATLPWLVRAAARFQQGRPGGLPTLVLLLALAGITPGGGLLSLLVTLPVVAWTGTSVAVRRTGELLAAWLVVNVAWWLPAVLGPGSGAPGPEGVTAFAARAELPLGTLGSLLGLGGIWDAAAVPASRGLPTASVFTLLVLVVALLGLGPLHRRLGPTAVGLAVGAAAGLVAAWWGSLPVLANGLGWLMTHVPGAALLRDGQRLVAPLAVLLSCAAALGVERATSGLRSGGARGAVVVLALALPIVVLPDLAWGVWGRIAPVQYPPSWNEVRQALATSDDHGDVVALPWQPFRRFSWNGNRVLLDPAPRYLPRTVVVDTRLTVGETTVADNNQRMDAVGAALSSGQPAVDTLPSLGVGWLLVEHGTPGTVPSSLLAGATPVVESPELTLYRISTSARGPGWPSTTPWVIGADVLALAVVAAAGMRVLLLRRAGRW